MVPLAAPQDPPGLAVEDGLEPEPMSVHLPFVMVGLAAGVDVFFVTAAALASSGSAAGVPPGAAGTAGAAATLLVPADVV
jgi:hypothetical protein